ncbi:hypothetical protein [Janibacter indicus]|nr:hypothetical protein [Janibacter indicus]
MSVYPCGSLLVGPSRDSTTRRASTTLQTAAAVVMRAASTRPAVAHGLRW